MKKVVAAAVILGALLAIVLVSIEEPETRMFVQTQTVAARDFVTTVDASGVVRPAESVDISAEVVGRLLAIRVRPGDPVVPGQIVALIDDAAQRHIVEEQRAIVRDTESALEDAEAGERDAVREHERAVELHEAGIENARRVEQTALVLERARISAERAHQAIERARSALLRTEEDLSKTVLRSPIQGIVLGVEMEEGEVVVANTRNLPGSRIMTLGVDAELIVESDIPEMDVVSVEVGQPVEISLAALSVEQLRGTVESIERVGQRDESPRFGSPTQGAEFLARIQIHDPAPGVLPSMSAQVRIETDRREDALAIPVGALVRRYPEGERELRSFSISFDGRNTDASAESTRSNISGDGGDQEPAGGRQVVFVVEDGTVRERLVTTGASDLLDSEITSGLREGDVVVVGPPSVLRELADGDDVVVRSGSASGDGGSPGRDRGN